MICWVISLNYLGVKDPASFHEDKGIFQHLLGVQNPNGSFCAWDQGPASRSVTRLYLCP